MLVSCPLRHQHSLSADPTCRPGVSIHLIRVRLQGGPATATIGTVGMTAPQIHHANSRAQKLHPGLVHQVMIGACTKTKEDVEITAAVPTDVETTVAVPTDVEITVPVPTDEGSMLAVPPDGR
jgi:hypothetical protein